MGWKAGAEATPHGTETKTDTREVTSPFLLPQTISQKTCLKSRCIFCSDQGYHVWDLAPRLGEIKWKAKSLPSLPQHQITSPGP